jgi:GAF domain-containing protein
VSSDGEILREVGRLASDVGTAIRPQGLDDLFRALTELARRTFGAAGCSVAILDERTDELVFVAASGEGAERVVGMRLPSDEGLAGWAVSSGQPIAIQDVANDPRFQQSFAGQTGYIPGSIVAMPLSTAERTVGVIELLDATGSGYEQLETVELFGRIAAHALAIADVFSHLGRSLFTAAAATADGTELGEALAEAAGAGRSDYPELDELAAALHELEAAGEEERRLAVRVLGEVLRYARRRRRGGPVR